MDAEDLVAGLVIAIGLVGTVVPLLPGTLLVALAVVGWAVAVDEATGWVLAALALAVLAVGIVVKYAIPHRNLRTQGVATRTMVAGGVLGVVGFFVVPVVGLPLGFVLGVYLSELQRLGRDAAWPATKAALRAVGLSMVIEMAAALSAAALWAVGALAT